LPTKINTAEVTIEVLGPLCKAHMVNGDAMTNAKRKPVLSQLMALSDTLKNCEAVLDTAEKVNQSQLTMMLSKTSTARPKKRLL